MFICGTIFLAVFASCTLCTNRRVKQTQIKCQLSSCEEAERNVLRFKDGSLPLLIPDSALIVEQTDFIENDLVRNVVLLQSAIGLVRQRDLKLHKRVLELTNTKSSCFVYLNEFSADFQPDSVTNSEQTATEADSLIAAYRFYAQHCGALSRSADGKQQTVRPIILSDRDDILAAAARSGALASSPRAFLDASVARDTIEVARFAALVDILKLREVAVDQPKLDSRGELLFDPYLTKEQIERGLLTGQLLSGVFRQNADLLYEAFVELDEESGATKLLADATSVPGEVSDQVKSTDTKQSKKKGAVASRSELDAMRAARRCFVSSLLDANRALDGDVVVVEPLPVTEWRTPRNVVCTDEQLDLATLERERTYEFALARRTSVVSTRGTFAYPCVRVVGIRRRRVQQCVGVIIDELDEDESPDDALTQVDEAPSVCFVRPSRSTLPRVRIETLQRAALRGQRVLIAIDGWPTDSRFPVGHFRAALGLAGKPETETRRILFEQEVRSEPFSLVVLRCLPREGTPIASGNFLSDPTVREQLANGRRADFRDLTIVSVDPPGCVDIDDALHCRVLPDGRVEVGVHIADVSHFVRPQTALDYEAAIRGTTVYLSDRRIDMIPSKLSTELCSLRADTDRLAVSVVWIFSSSDSVEPIETRFTKSLIRSRAALTYDDAQYIIDGNQKEVKNEQVLRSATLYNEVRASLLRLDAIARRLKAKRLESGALVLASSSAAELRFAFDSVTHEPTTVMAKRALDTNSLVEEMMLLANCYVARRILQEFPELAVLRRHPAPAQPDFDRLRRVVQRLVQRLNLDESAIALNTESGRALALSLDRIDVEVRKALENRGGQPKTTRDETEPTDEYDESYLTKLVRMACTRCMQQAKYFVAGAFTRPEHFHYGLAAPVYTHFTSPIRRYADLLVHRQLAVAIGCEPLDPASNMLNRRALGSTCMQLNYRHMQAQYAQRESITLHSSLYVAHKDKVLFEQAFLTDVKSNAFSIYVPKFGIEHNVLVDDVRNTSQAAGAAQVLPREIASFKCDELLQTVEIRFQDESVHSLHIFDMLVVRIRALPFTVRHQNRLVVHVHDLVSSSLQQPQLAGDEGAPEGKRQRVA